MEPFAAGSQNAPSLLINFSSSLFINFSLALFDNFSTTQDIVYLEKDLLLVALSNMHFYILEGFFCGVCCIEYEQYFC